MPMGTEDKIQEILKTLVSFNVETDMEDGEARDEFVNFFSEVVNSESDVAKNFLSKFIESMSDILVDMDIIEPPEDTTGEEVPPTEDGGVEGALDDLSVPASEGLDMSKLRSIADRANDFLM